MGRKKKTDEDFDYTQFKQAAIEGLMNGQTLLGKNGVLKVLIKDLVEGALDGELDAHLDSEKQKGVRNRRNGYTRKKLRSQAGEVPVNPPRDRDGSFSPILVEKWDRNIDTGLDNQILELYSLGNSYEDIQSHILQMYGVELSKGQISAITDRVWTKVTAWQQRALQSLYIVLFLDAIHFKIREDGVVKSKAVYTIYGVDSQGNRDVLALQVGQAEGAKQWGRFLENIKERGVEDVLFFAIDGLTGFKEAILEVFPESTVQRCVVHMLRSSLRFVDDVDFKPMLKDLKAIYTADDQGQGFACLDHFQQKWGEKYPEVANAWRENWNELTAFFGYNWAVRKLIYTTNAVEGLHRMMRKTTKTKAAFVSDKALIKLLYLTLMKKEKVWKKKVHSYKAIQRSLIREFGERFSKHLNL